MLQLRVVTNSGRTDELVAMLEPDPGVISLSVQRGGAVKPPGDVIVCDVLRERANHVIDALGDLRADDDGEIAIIEIDAELSDAARAVKRSLRGRGADAVVWEELSARSPPVSSGSWPSAWVVPGRSRVWSCRRPPSPPPRRSA